MNSHGSTIAGTGSYVPEKVLTNADLEEMVETSDEWIRTRTGIRKRHIAGADQATSDLARVASERALQAADTSAQELDLIIVATLSPDTPFPNTACHLQRKLGSPNAACFSLEAACSGFLYALETGSSLMKTGTYRRVLVVGAEKMSSILNWNDRGTCVLFGDGAGAVVLAPGEEMLLDSELGADGNYSDLLSVPGGGSAMPPSSEVLAEGKQYLHMNGREIFKLAVGAMADSCSRVLKRTGVSVEQVRWLVPHQANTRIINAVGKRLGFDKESLSMWTATAILLLLRFLSVWTKLYAGGR